MMDYNRFNIERKINRLESDIIKINKRIDIDNNKKQKLQDQISKLKDKLK